MSFDQLYAACNENDEVLRRNADKHILEVLPTLPAVVGIGYRQNQLTHLVAPFRIESDSTPNAKMHAFDVNQGVQKKFLLQHVQLVIV
jgi:hypothetical protein